MTNEKQEPQHNTKGTPCNIVSDCTSGKPAFYIVGKLYACIEHKDVAFEMQRRSRVRESLPVVSGFEPEVEEIEVEEVEVGKFAKLLDD